jgi:hypothetical protein
MVDNAGSVKIWEKGYSTSCDLCNTLVKAIATVAAAAGCQLAIDKITRCSEEGAVLADALSKADFEPLWAARAAWDLPVDPAAIPASLLRWVADPVSDEELGARILRELRRLTSCLGTTANLRVQFLVCFFAIKLAFCALPFCLNFVQFCLIGVGFLGLIGTPASRGCGI